MPLSTRLLASVSAAAFALALLMAPPAMAQAAMADKSAAQPTHYGVEPSHKALHDGTTHKVVSKVKAKPKAAKPVAKAAVKPAAKPAVRAASKHPSAHSQHAGKKAAAGAKRDANGKLARSAQQKAAFRKSHPCPSTGKSTGACPGYVVDHKVALKRGGADAPQNMQWQTKAAAKAKDKVE